MKNLNTLFLTQLPGIYDADKQIAEAPSKMAQPASGNDRNVTFAMLNEGHEIAEEFAIRASLIAAVQKIEEYEMASYDCLREWTELIGSRKTSSMPKENLSEVDTDTDSLYQPANSKSNLEAMREPAGVER